MNYQRKLKSLSTPQKIQEYLDATTYNIAPITRSARGVIEKKTAQCLDGALLAAAALEYQGHEPRLMDLRANQRDDDHVLAIFTYKNHFGAVAKSNYVGIRFREPVYRSLRELALSYFNNYVSLKRERTLVEYSNLIRLKNVQEIDWRGASAETDIYDPLAQRLDSAKHHRLFSQAIEKNLGKADRRLLQGEMVGLDKAGVFKG